MFSFDKNSVNSIIQKLNNSKILVIGDFAIDEMIYGDTSRISREAPVLILKHTSTNIILGGASNAAHNISALNGRKVSAIGAYGDDYHGPILLETLQNAGIDTSYMVVDKNRPTTTKTRISGRCSQSVTQQIIRIDREITSAVNGEVEAQIIDNINKHAVEFDAIVLSDYGLGMMTPNIIDASIKAAKKHNIFIAVDAQKNLDRYQGATVLTPNQPDTEQFVGYFINSEEKLMQAGKDMLEKTNAEMILLTRGGDGMALFEKGGKHCNIPVFNKTEVFDVTGAGDTVVATFISALCAGASPFEAAILGNLAASIVVRHFGCATTSAKELAENLNALNIEQLIKA